MYFKNQKHSAVRRFQWHILFMILASVILITFLAGFPKLANTNGRVLVLISGILLVISVFYIFFLSIILLREILMNAKLHNEKMDNMVEMLSRQNNLLMQVSQATQLSDTAKEIVFRDAEQMELGEAALSKLHQHDFDDAETMIAAMGQYPKYKDLSVRLQKMAEKYRSATEEGRVNQIITHIETLFDQKLWIQSAAQIETLMKTFPYSEKAKKMPLRLQERKDRRKRELLADWDIAVREKNTDRSLEILKELDLYLTPSEGLALRESASTVFKTKLHNMGVEFSVAVTEQQWQKALETGREIMQNFPNSRMAEEIRGKMDILLERAKNQNNQKQ